MRYVHKDVNHLFSIDISDAYHHLEIAPAL